MELTDLALPLTILWLALLIGGGVIVSKSSSSSAKWVLISGLIAIPALNILATAILGSN